MSQRICFLMVLVVAGLIAACAVGAQVDVVFDWATVGNAGNAADPLNSGSIPGIGSVGYEYRIATTEVTNAQYTVFLNTVDAAGTNPHGIYNAGMDSDARGGINFNAGAPSGSKYAAKPNMDNKPVNYVSFFDTMRFVNWLHNGQGAGGTESGVYNNIFDGSTETRATGAQFFLPTENEWYKAAYHQPTAQGGDSDNYWLYPTASNSVPTVASATAIGDIANPGPNVANYSQGADWNGQDGNVTTVGSASLLSASFYGTFDQGGNVLEWTETLKSPGVRVTRGGAWSLPDFVMRSSGPNGLIGLAIEGSGIGFRVASPIPEPGSLSLLLVGGLTLLRRRRAVCKARAAN